MAKFYWIDGSFLRELTKLLRRERQQPRSRGEPRSYPTPRQIAVNAQRAINVTSDVAVGGYYPATIQFKEAAAWVDSGLTCWAEDIAGGTLEIKRYEGMFVGVHSDGTGIYAVVKGGGGANHNILSTTHTDTSGAGAEAAGDIIYRDGTGKWTRLPLGTPTQFLGVSGSTIAWQVVPVGTHNLLSATHPDTTAGSGATGDLIRFSGTWQKYAIGSTGQVLTVSGGLPTWAFFNLMSSTIADMGTGGFEATGDTLFRDGTGKWNRLPIGAANEVLTVVGGIPDWVAPAAAANHNLLSATHPDTVVGSPVEGDILIANNTPAWTKLAHPGGGKILRSFTATAKLRWDDDFHNLLDARHPDTSSAGLATGSILYRSAGGIWVVLGIGASGNYLRVSAGLPAWQAWDSLTVKESDGTPSVSGVTTINVDQSSKLKLTDNTGGSVTIAADGLTQTETIVTAVTCSGSTLNVTTKSFVWTKGILVSIT